MRLTSVLKYCWVSFAMMAILSCSNLKKEEIAKLDHDFSGCLGSAHNVITLYDEKGKTFSKLETNGHLIKDVKVSNKQMTSFSSFIQELRNLKERDGCTTVETYVLFTKKETFKRTDGGCNWDGFNILKRALFDNSN